MACLGVDDDDTLLFLVVVGLEVEMETEADAPVAVAALVAKLLHLIVGAPWVGHAGMLY